MAAKGVAEGVTYHNANDSTSITLSPREVESPQSLHKVLAMRQGEGEDSYSKNSKLQDLQLTKLASSGLHDALEHVTLPTHGPVLVADLGCSSGPNTIGHLDLIVKKLRTRSTDAALLEYQGLFNDLPSNDFNCLFQHLSSDARTSSRDTGKSLFLAGVPGSFYDRIFTRASIHVFLSTASIAWLSKVPEEILDRNSPAFNKDRVWTYGSSPETAKAYKKQSAMDLRKFLSARATEMAPGGLLFFTTPTVISQEATVLIDNIGLQCANDVFNETWTSLVAKGVLTQEQKDTFNIPCYFRTLEDVKEIVEAQFGSSFHLHSINVIEKKLDVDELFPDTKTKEEQAVKYSKSFKAVIPNLLESHIGKEKATVFLQHYDEVALRIFLPAILDAAQDPSKAFKSRILSVALIRK